MKKERAAYIKACEISEIAEVILGGFPQKILLEGKHKDTPILLILHGGPGFPVPFCVGARGLFPVITENFTAVYWDQFGCGINNKKQAKTLMIADFVNMAKELVAYLKSRFAGQKILVFSMSWGSILSAYLASEGLVDGVVAAGQVVKAPLVSEETIRAVERSKAPEKKKKFVRGILETEPTFEDSMKLSKIVRKYTNAYYGKEQPAGKGIVSEIFHSPDYSFKNKMACFMNYTSKNRDLVMELAKIDLSEELLKSPVPYAVFAGECDIVTPLCPVEEIASKNPNLTAEQVAGAGHFPSDMYMKSVFERLRELI